MRMMKSTSEKVRTETFQGKEFTVVPVIAIVEGVLQAANSDKPELVKASEFDPQAWNGRPVTFEHPDIGGILVSASASPEIFESVQVGTIFNAEVIEGSKLRLEAWIDGERVNEQGDLAIEAFNKILNNETVEISTGYFADSTIQSGKFNGKQFEAIQSSLKPDHLAILVGDQKGACSVEDGCGAPRTNIHFVSLLNSDGTVEKKGDLTWYTMSDLSPSPTGNKEQQSKEQIKEQQNKKKTKFSDISDLLTFKKHGETSDMDVRKAISSALESKGEFFWGIVAVFQEKFVFERDFGVLEEREFSISDDGTVNISDDGVDVRPVTEFIPVITNENQRETKENVRMKTKEEKISALISNEQTQFSEDERSFLEGLDEAKLDMLAPVPVKTSGKEIEEVKETSSENTGSEAVKNSDPVLNKALQEKKPQSVEDYISSAPPEMQEVLGSGLKMQREHRASLVKMITSNTASGFKEEDLKGFSVEQLDKMARMAAPADYVGRSASPVSNFSHEDESIPDMPDMFPVKTQQAAS